MDERTRRGQWNATGDAPTDRPLPSLRVLLALTRTAQRLAPRGPRSVAQHRAASARSLLRMAVVTRVPSTPLRVVDAQVPVDGGTVRVRRYRPADRDDEPLPTHVFAHGGAYWLGDVDDYDPLCRGYAAEVGCQVVSVDYRRAPEHPYPVPLDDCFAVLTWVAEHAGVLGVDPHRISVGGVSAGGGLAAALALRARDAGGPALCLQVLEIPMLDASMESPSLREFAHGHHLTRDDVVQGWDRYLPDADRRGDPWASPAAATAELTGLPPAYVLTCGCDPLRDEGEAYAVRLRQAGVPVEAYRAVGHVHGSVYLTRLLPSARAAVARTMAAMRRAYAVPDQPA